MKEASRYSESTLELFAQELSLQELLGRLSVVLCENIENCNGLLIAYRPTLKGSVLCASTSGPLPEIQNLLRALEQTASLCCEATELDQETQSRVRRLLGAEAHSTLLFPVRPRIGAAVELSIIVLLDRTVPDPKLIFEDHELHSLLFNLRGALIESLAFQESTSVQPSGKEELTAASMAEVGAALTTALNLEDLSRLILEISAKLVNAHQANIRLVEGQTEVQEYSIVRAPAPEENAHLYLPIARHGRLKALLSLERDSSKLEPFIVKTLHHFTEQAAMAIENAQIFEWEQERAREATALYQAARTIEEAHELEDILSSGTEVFTRLAGVDRCMILLKDSRKSFFAVASASGLSDDQEHFFGDYRLPISKLSPENKQSLFQGKPIIFDSAPGKGSGFLDFTSLLPSYASLILPLKSHEKLLGMIFLDSSRGAHHFTPASIRQLLTLSLQLANAIQRASLIQKLQENLGPLKALYQVSTAITGTLSLPRVIRLIVGQTVELLDYVSCALLVLDETGESFRIETNGPPGDEAFRQPSFQARMAKAAVETKKAHAHYVDQDETEIEVRNELVTHGYGGLLSVPLIAKKKMVGVLNCFVPPKMRFRQQEIRLLKGFANQAAIAVDNARLHGLIRFKMNELGTLFEISKAVTSTLQLSKVLDEIVYHVRSILNAEACVLMLKEGKVLKLKAIKGWDPSLHKAQIALGEGSAGVAAQTGQTVVYDGSEPLPVTDPEIVVGTGLSVPIKTRGHIIGLINVYYTEHVDHTPAQLSLLSTLCGQAAVAIENARLFADKEKVTELLRGALIPGDEMQFKSLTIGHRFIPSQDLSGDYYDLIPLGPKKCAFVIADVSGKGTEAAIQTIRAKHVIRSYATAGYGPSKILTLLNQQVLSSPSHMSRPVTVFYAEACLEEMTLTFASAGHEQPLFWTPECKKTQLLKAEGIMIGAWDDVEYEEKTLDLVKNSWLLLYTDGLTEARSPSGEFFGLERIQAIAEEHTSKSAQRLVNQLYSRIRKFTREHISDDFSLLAVKF